MSKTKIEWTSYSWNVIIGCSKKSPGCLNCYAERMAKRLAAMGNNNYRKVLQWDWYKGAHEKWNGETVFVESALEKPLRWRKPRLVFVCSMSDLFHESVPFEWIDRVMAIVALCPQHIFQLLTKRPERMLEYFTSLTTVEGAMRFRADDPRRQKTAMMYRRGEYLENLWIGTTIESNDQRHRADTLIKIPAIVRFISAEPLLSEIDFTQYLWDSGVCSGPMDPVEYASQPSCLIDQIICGAESGPGKRHCDINWIRSLRDQCIYADVPFFLKQMVISGKMVKMPELDGQIFDQMPPIRRTVVP